MLRKLFKNDWSYLTIAAIASGLYAIIHTCGSNFELTNSWIQLLVMITFFIVFPILVFGIVKMIVNKVAILQKYQAYSIPILNAVFFTFFILGKTYGFNARRILVVGCFGVIFLAIVLQKHYKKVVIFQLLLAIVAFVKIPPLLYAYLTKSDAWLQQPDAIEEVQFKKHPNIYIIQPDGYANFSELPKGKYNYDNSDFETYLKSKKFKLYPSYRSNYMLTVLSNSAMFAMKHHYLSGYENKAALHGMRNIIIGENSAVSILKNNQYQTSLLLEYPYLLLNRPPMAYDHCNISYSQVPWFGVGAFKTQYETVAPLEKAIKNNIADRNFYFIEKIAPSHITTAKTDPVRIEEDRKGYLERLEEANKWLEDITDVIIKNDPNSLIVITADHGGFVGLDYYAKITEKQTDRDIIYSVFSAALAIRWPDGNIPEYDTEIDSPVNLFRVLFSYLSEDTSYLRHLEKDQSFSLIQEGAPYGVYEYIDDEGNIVFNKHENTAKSE